jgi:hypothetical protein
MPLRGRATARNFPKFPDGLLVSGLGEQLSWLSRVTCIIFIPRGPMFPHGVEHRQPLAHTRGEGDLRRVPDRPQSLIERLADGMVAHRCQGAHVQHGAPVRPPVLT